MSTDLKPVMDRYGEVQLTSFSGGMDLVRGGRCLQLTGNQTYLSLTKTQCLDLAEALLEFVNDEREES